MSYADDANITDNSPIYQYLAVPIPNSTVARENALGAMTTLLDAWRYGLSGEAEGYLSQWHENNQAEFCTEILGIIGAEVIVKVAIIWDEKAQGVNGGTFTAGAWRQRDLNTKLDPDNLVTVVSNAVTIAVAGKYWIRASAPAFYNVYRHQARLTINSNQVAIGSSEDIEGAYVTTHSIIIYTATLNQNDILRLEHRCEVPISNYGFGLSNTWGVNVYSIIEIIKMN